MKDFKRGPVFDLNKTNLKKCVTVVLDSLKNIDTNDISMSPSVK